MTNKAISRISKFIVTLCLLPSTAIAIPILDPIADLGLSPGDTYHYVFVTANLGDATSPDISDYNNFVTNEAEQIGSLFAGDSLRWSAIASTPAVDARDNALAGTNSPIFLPNGQLIATGFFDLWDGIIASPINVDQFGDAVPSYPVWTGSNTDGFGVAGDRLGEISPIFGTTSRSSGGWIDIDTEFIGDRYKYYALSEEISVSAIPLPAGIWLFGTALLGLVGFSKRRKLA